MGYEVHITRKVNWFEEDGPTITLQEWLDYVSSDPEMRADGYAEAKAPDGVLLLRTDNEGIAVWTAYAAHGVNGNQAWFCHFDNRITVKNPDVTILIKMYQISSELGAKVQGDEGEEYGPDGNPNVSTVPHFVVPVPASTDKAWWKFWK